MITWFLEKEADMLELFSNTCHDIKWLINLIWFKKLIKVVYLLRLFNLTLIFPSPGCPLKRAWGNGLVGYPTLLQDPIMLRRFVLSPRDSREPLLMFVKDKVVLLEYHALTYCISIVASALCSLQGFCCRNFQFRFLVV